MVAPAPVVPYAAPYGAVVVPRPIYAGPVIGAGWGYGPRFYGPRYYGPRYGRYGYGRRGDRSSLCRREPRGEGAGYDPPHDPRSCAPIWPEKAADAAVPCGPG